jgi:archaeal cell division control protein 6
MSKQVSLIDVLNFDNSLFTDKQAVKSNYALAGIKDILHRDNEIKKYYTYLKDIFRGVSPNNIFVYGTAGVGKTVLSKWVFEEIKKEAINRNIELCIIKVKCDVSKTENSIWQAINDQMPTPEGEEKRRIGNSISKHAKYFEHLMNEYPGIIIMVLLQKIII